MPGAGSTDRTTRGRSTSGWPWPPATAGCTAHGRRMRPPAPRPNAPARDRAPPARPAPGPSPAARSTSHAGRRRTLHGTARPGTSVPSGRPAAGARRAGRSSRRPLAGAPSCRAGSLRSIPPGPPPARRPP
eukprot:9965915-Lingulodinium_polyedra.AAC.1